MATDVSEIPIIDTDTHVVEPPDLWTSRVSSKWGDLVPHVALGSRTRRRRRGTAATSASAPSGRRRWPDGTSTRRTTRDASRTPTRRRGTPTQRRGGDGPATASSAQILYPNVAVFDAKSIVDMGDPELQLACIQGVQRLPRRLRRRRARAVRRRRRRCRSGTSTRRSPRSSAAPAIGHKGIVFTQDPSYFGLPELTDRYWDPMWASAAGEGAAGQLPHRLRATSTCSTSATPTTARTPTTRRWACRSSWATPRRSPSSSPAASATASPSSTSCRSRAASAGSRSPSRRSTGSGRTAVCAKEHPEYDLLPSEYFRRQIYGCFWFERDTALSAIEQLGADNILYETDFPHPTSMSPGPASTAQRPDDYLRANVRRPRRDVVAQDPPRQRRADLPPRLTDDAR